MRRNYIYMSCLLFLAATLSLLSLSTGNSIASSEVSVIEGHNTCAQCHGRFPGSIAKEKSGGKISGRPAVIPAKKIDQLCFGCHGPGGIAKKRAHIHGIQNYVAQPIGCITCHNPHDNITNSMDGQNIKLIGQDLKFIPSPSEPSHDQHYAKIKTPNSGIRPVVFERRGTDVGEPSMNSFADGDEDRNGSFNGVCEVCHTKTKFHRNNPSGSHDHYNGQTCTNCHLHVNQFLAFEEEPGDGLELSGTIIDDTGFAWEGITVFLDINGNGVWDEGEPIAVTDENGKFVFKGIVNKGYDILIMPGSVLEGYDVTITTDGNVVIITTTAQPASVEGYVWSDVNRSGQLEEDDAAIAGVTIFADLNSNEAWDTDEPTVTTDDFGYYTITELPHGPYWIQVDTATVPEEYQHITNNNPFYTVLDPGQELTDINFGYRSRFEFDPNNTRLLYPTRLTWTQNGGYYVTDSKVDAIFIHDSTGNLTGQLRGLNKPLGVISDAQGRIYVGNNGRNNVEIYSAGGVLLQVIGDGNLKMPNDLVFDNEQNLYVLDSQNKMVKVFSPDGLFVRRIGNAGGGDGQFTFPVAIAINYRTVDEVEVGELFVADKKSSRIQVFDLEGNYLRSFGGPVEEESGGGMMGWFGGGGTTWNSEGKFVGVQSLAFDQNGKLHALDSFQDNVQILDPVTGAYISHYDAFLEDTVPTCSLM